MQGKLITIFGGGGFLGRYVAQTLLGQGARVRVACRNANSAIHIKPLGNLGQVQLMEADVRKPASVARAVRDADAVINLVGSFADMNAVQNIGAGVVAKAAADAGVKALVHISAIGADALATPNMGKAKLAGKLLSMRHFPPLSSCDRRSSLDAKTSLSTALPD